MMMPVIEYQEDIMEFTRMEHTLSVSGNSVASRIFFISSGAVRGNVLPGPFPGPFPVLLLYKRNASEIQSRLVANRIFSPFHKKTRKKKINEESDKN